MPTEFKIADPKLDQTPEGRFLLAVGEAIRDLNIEDLALIQLDKRIMAGDEKRPAAWIAPGVEVQSASREMGRYTATYRALVYVTAGSIDSRALPLSWHLIARDKLSQRFSGMTAAGARVSYGNDCFSVQLLPGVKLDHSFASDYSLDASSFVIQGDYRG